MATPQDSSSSITTFFLTDADYSTDKDTGRVVVRLAGVHTETNETVIIVDKNFQPYFYIVPEEKADLKELSKRLLDHGFIEGGKIEKVATVTKTLSGKRVKVLQAFLKHPSQVKPLRSQARELKGVSDVMEADILFVRRYLIDHDLKMLGACSVRTENENGTFIATSSPKSAGDDVSETSFTPRVMAFDIETYNPQGMPRAEQDPIIMISLASTSGLSKVISFQDTGSSSKPQDETTKTKKKKPKYVEVLETEKEMIERFAQIIQEDNPHIITGYNSDQFDFPYIKKRAERLGARFEMGLAKGSTFSMTRHGPFFVPKCFGRVIIDIYQLVRNLISKSLKAETLDLDTVANELLGEGKVKGVGYAQILALWEKQDLRTLYEYSLKDSEITLQLSLQLLPSVYELSALTRTPLYDASRMTSGQLVEWFLIRHAHKQGILVPRIPQRMQAASRMQSTYVGGFVVKPKRGLHKNIVVVDFRSLYPSIIIGHNVDPATLNCTCCETGGNVSPSGAWFCEKKQGFLPQVLNEILTKRFEYKARLTKMKNVRDSPEYRFLDARQNGLKIIANSMYGYLGYSRARWYSLDCAKAITALGRKYIQDTIKLAEDDGFTVLYGDTDSVFFSQKTGAALSKSAVERFIDKVNKTLPESMELELQGIYKRGVLIAKKRYAMIDGDGRIIVKGLERVRRDWASIAKDTQEEVLRAILDKGDPNLAFEVLRETIERLHKRKVSMGEVMMLTQLTRDPENYKVISPHVAAAKRAIAAGIKEYRAGMLVRFVITTKNREKKTISSSAFPVEQVTIKDYDPEYYINNQVVPATMRIFEALGYDESILADLLSTGSPQTRLKKFF